MFEGERKFYPEKEQGFSLERLTVEAVSSAQEMEGKLKEINWPLELQGKGMTDLENRSLLIKFPKGDVILSFITTIHEIGHLGQEQLNSSLKVETQTHESLAAQEKDAWRRGWERMINARPDILDFLESKLGELRKKNTAVIISNVEELYKWVESNALKMVDAQRVLFESDSAEPLQDKTKQDKLFVELKNAGVDDFLNKYNSFRLGETVDEGVMINFIKDVVKSVIVELNK